MKKMLAILVMLFAVSFANAGAVLKITEMYTGLEGEDGTADWFEVTNFGDAAWDLSDAPLYYLDNSDYTESLTKDKLALLLLDGDIIAAGESVVFLVDNEIGTFETVWGTGIKTGFADGKGLGQTGDSVNLYTATGDVVATATYASSGAWATFVSDANGDMIIDGDGNPTLAVTGVLGAYESNDFYDVENDDVDITLIGSPGVVPEPATLTILGAGAVAFFRRRK